MYDEGRESVVWGMTRLMHRLHNALHSRLLQIGLYRGQPPVLHFLCAQGPMSQKDLADRLSLSPATMTVTLKRMEKAGLIAREADPTDQRVQLVSPTDKGRAMNERAAAVMEEIRQTCLLGISDEEKAQLAKLLQRIGDNLVKEEHSLEE